MPASNRFIRWDRDDLDKVRHMARRHDPAFIARYMGMSREYVERVISMRVKDPNRKGRPRLFETGP